MTVKEKRSPLKKNPLHYPGQSADEELDHIKKDMSTFGLVSLFFVAVAVLECWRWFTHSPPQPIVATVCAVVVGVYCIPKFFKLRRLHDNYELGRNGEREVGQALEKLRTEGYCVFHDVVANHFNVDHVIVCKRGIFSIETKTYRKREGNPKITFDGEKTLVDNKPTDRDAVEQARRSAKWLRGELFESTGKWLPVKPVVVFPGWWVEEENKGDVWVLNPDRLKAKIAGELEILSKDEMQSAQSLVSWLVRRAG